MNKEKDSDVFSCFCLSLTTIVKIPIQRWVLVVLQSAQTVP